MHKVWRVVLLRTTTKHASQTLSISITTRPGRNTGGRLDFDSSILHNKNDPIAAFGYPLFTYALMF